MSFSSSSSGEEEEMLLPVPMDLGATDDSSYSSSSTSGSSAVKHRNDHMGDDSSAESDGGWSESSGHSAGRILGEADRRSCSFEVGQSITPHEPSDRGGLHSNTPPNGSEHASTSIIQKIILTRKKKFHGSNTKNLKQKGLTSGVGVDAKQKFGSSIHPGFHVDPTPSPLTGSAGQPSPKPEANSVDTSPKQPMRRSESDDESDSDSDHSETFQEEGRGKVCLEDVTPHKPFHQDKGRNANEPTTARADNDDYGLRPYFPRNYNRLSSTDSQFKQDNPSRVERHGHLSDSTHTAETVELDGSAHTMAAVSIDREPPPSLLAGTGIPPSNRIRTKHQAQAGSRDASVDEEKAEIEDSNPKVLGGVRGPTGVHNASVTSLKFPTKATKVGLAFCALCCCLILGAAAGVLLGFTLFSSNADDGSAVATVAPTIRNHASLPPSVGPRTTEPTKKPTFMPSIVRSQTMLFDVPYTPILDALSAVSSDGGTAIRQFGTPQQQAYLWLIEDLEPQQRTTTLRRSSRSSMAPVDAAATNVALRRIFQRYAMATFYYSTQGFNWNIRHQWMNASLDECYWGHQGERDTNGSSAAAVRPFAVSSCESGNSNDTKWLTTLELHENNLEGQLPPELGLLTNLRRLVIKQDTAPTSQNTTTYRQVKGSIPSEIGLLAELDTLILNGHGFGGNEPESTSSFVPNELGNTQALRVLNLNNNEGFGTLPSVLGSLTMLQRLDLGNNALVGSLPIEWGELANLELLILSHNQLNGTLPGHLFADLAPSLQGLFLDTNQLSGSLPSDLALLSNLDKGLHLQQNQLEGTLPPEMGSLVNLTSFKIHGNHFNGTIPEAFGGWKSILTLQLNGNDLNGTVPEALCSNLEENRRQEPWLSVSSADCPTELDCPCCQFCCTDGQGCANQNNSNNKTSNTSSPNDMGSLLFSHDLLGK